MYVYWGNTNATVIPDYATNSSTWSSGYKGVWHFNSENIDDSMVAGNDGSATGTVNAECVIGAGQRFSEGDQIAIPDHTDFHGYDTTMSLWFKGSYSVYGGEGATLIDRRASSGIVTVIDADPSGSVFVQGINGNLLPNGNNSEVSGLNDGDWHYLTVMYPTNIGTGYIYVDGTQAGTVTVAKAWSWPAAAIELGKSHDSYWKKFIGDMDEFRVVEGFRSADWIKAEYDSQRVPGIFSRLEKIYYWDTDIAAGLQSGSGTWSTNSAYWSDIDSGSSSLLPWLNMGLTAYFVPGGTSDITVDSVTAMGIVIDGNGYSFLNGTISVGANGIIANENVTIGSDVVLLEAQSWGVAEDLTNTVSGIISGNRELNKTGAGQLTLSGAGTFSGDVNVDNGILEVLAKNGDVNYQVASNATLKIGYSIRNKTVKVYGSGVSSDAGLYLKGGSEFGVNARIQLLDAPSTIHCYGSGTATIGQWDVRFYSTIWCSADASGSIVDENIRLVSRGYGLTVRSDVGTNTAVGDLIFNGPLDVNHSGNGFYKRGGGTLLLNAPATVNNKRVRIEDGTVICGTNDCLGVNALIDVSAGKTLDLRATSQSVSNVTFSSTAVLDLDLNSRPSYGQLDVAGTVTISNVTLNAAVEYKPEFIEKYFIIINDGSDPIMGTFANETNGVVSLGSYDGTAYEGLISYTGDSDSNEITGGNDVVIYYESQGLLLMVR